MQAPNSSPDTETIDQAAAWFARAHAPDASSATQAGLDAWLAVSAQNRAAYGAVSRLWSASPALLAALPQANAAHPIQTRTGWVSIATRIAAVLILIAGGAGVFLLSNSGARDPKSFTGSVATPITQESVYTTDTHNRSAIALPDGSLAVLSPGSEIHVAYSMAARSIRLVRGQALFEVAKHIPRPFYVLVGDRRVMATGTAFDVKMSDPEKLVMVTLVEGNVLVERPASKSPQVVRMHAGERLVARAGMQPQIARTNFDDITNWRTERLTFYETPLSAVVATLNRYGGPVITLSSTKLGGLKVDGTLRTNDPVAAAHAIAKIYGLHISRPSRMVLLSE